ncbi:MAG TPA: Ig-like domain-containing protein, partial [Bryobacteraceae bacterium]|nr:Ig-like domain-containing protein [Bryobacteraceae bacterium]
TASGVIGVRGWSIDANAPIVSVGILVDGNTAGTAVYGNSRPDVCAAFPGTIGCPNVGWTGSLDTSVLANGTHSLQVTATDANGVSFTSATPFTVANDVLNAPTHVNIDTPGPGYTYHGSLTFAGWAVNDNTSISTVQVYVDGALRGPATSGLSRGDVCVAFPGRSGCPNVGWSYFIDTNALADGTHNFSVTATAANGQRTTVANNFVVANWTTANPVLITIDTPSASSGAFSGTATFAGWALDANTPIGSVTVAVDGVVYGNSNYNLARPDVCTVYPGIPGCPNVGWNAMIDTTQLADGVHTLSITANPISGQSFTTTTQFSVANLGTAANPLRIMIDNPSVNGVVSGVAGVRGWALSDNSPISGVQVRVDGVLKGTAVYGENRPDVCAVYASRPGCPNVGWNYSINTTQLTNGSHTLEITATTAAGGRATASSPFMVSNGDSSATGPARVSIDSPSANSNPFIGVAQFFGWAMNDNSLVTAVSISVDGVPYGNANYGSSRPDVCAALPGRPGCPNVGWSFSLDTTRFADGVHTLGVTEVMADGTFFTATSSFTVANWSTANPMKIMIDSPTPQAPLVFGIINLQGWVINGSVPIANVTLAIDGVPFGNAGYGAPRPDVCSAFASTNCPNVGWSYTLNTTFLANGQHTLGVTGTTTLGQTSTSTVVFGVVN